MSWLFGANSCGVKPHTIKVAIQPRCIFMNVPEKGRSKNSAFCDPFIEIDRIGDKLQLLQRMEFSVKTWNSIFTGFKNLEDVTEDN